MATRIFEIELPQIAQVNRAQKTVQMPTGATIVKLMEIRADAPRLIVIADPVQPDTPRSFSAVKGGIILTAAEQAGSYVGSWMGYRTSDGPEIYHLIEVATT